MLSICTLAIGMQMAQADGYHCNASGELKWAMLEHVIDGDTLRLRNRVKVRAIAINAPELGTEHRPPQAFSRQARQAVVEFFGNSNKVGLQSGIETEDRYGRALAHIYRADGVSLAEYLLAKGLAFHILVPPNNAYWECLAKVEITARRAAVGLWQPQGLQIKFTANLKPKDSGFQLVEGVVESVARSRDSFWLTLGKLVVRIRDNDLKYFDDQAVAKWQGKRIRLRGWVIDRSQLKLVKKNNFQPFIMNLRHQTMMK